MSTAQSKSDSNSRSDEGDPSSVPIIEDTRGKPRMDRFGMFPECVYCGWNIFFGLFLLFTTAFMRPGDTASVVTQCFGVVYIFAGLLSFVIIFKSARSIFVVLTVFAAMTTVLTSLTILGFAYSIDGSMPMPELMMTNKYLELIVGALLLVHIVINVFSFFIFLKRSCKSSAVLDNAYSQRSVRGTGSERQEKGSAEIIEYLVKMSATRNVEKLNTKPARHESKSGLWGETFPRDLEVEDSSYKFAFRFIKCTTAFILDKRGVLPSECFVTRRIDKIQCSNFDKKNTLALTLNDKLNGVAEAIEKGYLREFAIVFFQPPNEEKILEVYTFRLQYKDDDSVQLSLTSGLDSQEFSQNLVNTEFNNLDDTKSKFIETMKTLYRVIKKLVDLPADIDGSFRLSYTDKAPKDYVPEGFCQNEKFYEISQDMLRKQLGIVCGGFHKVQVLAASELLKEVDMNITFENSANLSCVVPTPQKRKSIGVQRNSRKHRPYGCTRSIQGTPAKNEIDV
ncbi:unnamed protein product [Caenorhabditis sp. 36 PRJEB53466]|nr:unnamed protein product [Caenorhabditis sp. 36 PRJEB53466]